jgi:hypothetical protein
MDSLVWATQTPWAYHPPQWVRIFHSSILGLEDQQGAFHWEHPIVALRLITVKPNAGEVISGDSLA